MKRLLGGLVVLALALVSLVGLPPLTSVAHAASPFSPLLPPPCTGDAANYISIYPQFSALNPPAIFNNQFQVTFTNLSSCSNVQVGVASYEFPTYVNGFITEQKLYASSTGTLAPTGQPGDHVTLTVVLPPDPCTTQADAFQGPVLTPPDYGTHLLGRTGFLRFGTNCDYPPAGGPPPPPPNTTPELGSGELLATGVLPILALALYRRRSRRAQDGPTT